MAFVVDASIAAAWMLPDEQTGATDAVLERLTGAPALVPSLFWHEARSLFLTAERRGRFPPGAAQAAMLRLRLLPIEDRGSGNDQRVLELAAAQELTAYDAAYLALAVDEDAALATLDRKLAAAARRQSVPLLGPLAEP
jgi:predicted nucleic acid-binding protein